MEEEYLDDVRRIVGRASNDAGNVAEEELDEKANVVGLLDFIGAYQVEGAGPRSPRPPRGRPRVLDVDLSIVDGTGSGDRILVKDAERAAKNQG